MTEIEKEAVRLLRKVLGYPRRATIDAEGIAVSWHGEKYYFYALYPDDPEYVLMGIALASLYPGDQDLEYLALELCR